MAKYDIEVCKELLRKKYQDLSEQDIKRYPQRSDFSNEEVNAIKAYLGPWPRALEKAGIKPVNEELIEKKRQRRIAMRRKQRERKIEAKKAYAKQQRKDGE